MKKIGIMSMQRIKNYGSILQAYGLKQIIEDINKNYKVEFIDYCIEPSIVYDENVEKFFDNTLKRKINKKIIGGVFTFYHKLFWLPKYLNVKKSDYNKDVSTLVIGSDEVFNCTQKNKRVGFSKELFGKNFENSNVISYAASFGFTTSERLKKYKIYDEVSSLLSNNFSSISVRDKNSQELITELTGKEPFVNLDPVLVSNINKLAKGKVKYKNYIILYSYACRISKEEGNIIREYARKHNKKIISIGTYQECADKNIVVDPFIMLNYFKHADKIITDTFHGTIFSIIYNKEFVSLIRDSNSNKLVDLLDRLKLKSRIINDLNDLEKYFKKNTNYELTNKIIEEEKNKTIKYLKENIK